MRIGYECHYAYRMVCNKEAFSHAVEHKNKFYSKRASHCCAIKCGRRPLARLGAALCRSYETHQRKMKIRKVNQSEGGD